MSGFQLMCLWLIWAAGIFGLLVLSVFVTPHAEQRTPLWLELLARVWIFGVLGILVGLSAMMIIRAVS